MSSYIDYHRFPRGESCTEDGCRSRKYYIEDGKKFCQRGHEQAGFTQTQQDEDDWNTQGKKSRKHREEKERVVKVLNGRDAIELYLQCYELIVWKQVYWLIHTKGFPAQLEIVVKDLWELRNRPVMKSTNDSGYGSTSGTLFSSASEGDTDTDGTRARSFSSRHSRRDVSRKEKLPKLIETLGLCYLGMVLLQLPVSLGEIYQWAAKEEMIYTRAIKVVPKEMRTRLPAYLYSALEIRAQLRGPKLYGTANELLHFYHIHYAMEVKPLNFPWLIVKHMTGLGLPVELYPAVHRLAELLKVDFTFSVEQNKPSDIQTHPEIQLLSMIVLATKLSHPFDDIERVAENTSDPGALRVNWAQWQKIMMTQPYNGLRRGEEIKVKDADVLNLTGKQVDDYLDWYKEAWIDDRDLKMAEQILELFPLHEPQSSSEDVHEDKPPLELLKEVQGALVVQTSKPIEAYQDENIIRSGQLYARYRTVEELPENAKAFYAKAAENSGMSLGLLVRAVFQMEIKLDNWILEDRKKTLRESGEEEEERSLPIIE